MTELQFVKDGLQRAASEGDLVTAQDYADRVRRLLDQLSTAAVRCDCPPARDKFSAAAAAARRAAEQEQRRDLRTAVADTRTLFDEAYEAFKNCRASTEK
ncbi:MAG: hypothetical protein JNJ60_08545 [Rhodocyclaceae bacterium]|nr:hypothetical protein [Rhodocyclaceae bacterium]